MAPFWRTLRDYILWSYERGSVQYDVMVTLILLFIFVSPYWINFKDKPRQRDPHRTEVVAIADGKDGILFEIDGSGLYQTDEQQLRAEMLQIIEPISGNISITKYERIADGNGVFYKIWARRK